MSHGLSHRANQISDRAMLWLILSYNTLITAALFFLLPLLIPIVAATAKRRQTFFQRMGLGGRPRQGSVSRPNKKQRIWVHALSVGEVMAAQPLMTELMASHGDAELYFSASTLTGFQTARRLFESRPVRLHYFPYDWIWAVRKVVSMINPTHVIITETDIWPTFLWEMKRKRVPVYLVNLRISDHTWKNYLRYRWLAGKAFGTFDRLCVQTHTETERLKVLGVADHRVCRTGNLKFDGFTLPTDADSVLSWRNRWNISKNHKMIVAGSTHSGEEAILGDIVKFLLTQNYDLSMIIAPRDPLRGHSVRTLIRNKGLECEFLSNMEKGVDPNWPQVVVVDSIGPLKALYRLAYISFVGGSLVPFGGHNPLEAAFWGKPVLFGNDMRDFTLVAEYLINGGGAVRVRDAAHLKSVISHLLDNPEAAVTMGESALGVLKKHRGAVVRTLSFLNMMDIESCKGARKAS